MTISIKRAYEEPDRGDGFRVLVDRVWPRGKTREDLALNAWAKPLAPSTDLRKWFGHDPERWNEFKRRYRTELGSAEAKAAMRALLEEAGARNITLVYGAKDEQHSQALVLREILEKARASKR
jgi:uncharacterized protein YeaO (DUF488 family)